MFHIIVVFNTIEIISIETQQLKNKYSSFQDILLFNFSGKTINSTCLILNEQENIQETIYMENDKLEHLNESDIKKNCCVCKYFQKFNVVTKNNEFNELLKMNYSKFSTKQEQNLLVSLRNYIA